MDDRFETGDQDFEIEEVELSEYTGEIAEDIDISDATEVQSLGSMNDYDLLKDKTQKL